MNFVSVPYFFQSAIVLRGGENKEVRFKGKTVSFFSFLLLLSNNSL